MSKNNKGTFDYKNYKQHHPVDNESYVFPDDFLETSYIFPEQKSPEEKAKECFSGMLKEHKRQKL